MTAITDPAAVTPPAAETPPAAAAVTPPAAETPPAATPPVAAATPPAAETPPATPPATETPPAAELVIPDGVTIDAAVLDKVKALDVSPEVRQAILDLGIEQSKGFTDGLQKVHDEAVAQWIEDAKADKDIGGDKFDENRAIAVKAFEAFGTPELKIFLETSGLGNHPELLKWAHKVGKAMSDDKVVPGGNTPGKKSGFASIYTNPTSNIN